MHTTIADTLRTPLSMYNVCENEAGENTEGHQDLAHETKEIYQVTDKVDSFLVVILRTISRKHSSTQAILGKPYSI